LRDISTALNRTVSTDETVALFRVLEIVYLQPVMLIETWTDETETKTETSTNETEAETWTGETETETWGLRSRGETETWTNETKTETETHSVRNTRNSI